VTYPNKVRKKQIIVKKGRLIVVSRREIDVSILYENREEQN